jgi:hypothetical protein
MFCDLVGSTALAARLDPGRAGAGFRRTGPLSVCRRAALQRARAGRLNAALRYAERVQEMTDAVANPRPRAWIAMNSEPHLYRGDWQAVVRIAETALPAAWKIREWIVVVFASAWLAIAYLQLGRAVDAKQVLDRVLREVPRYTFPVNAMQRKCNPGSISPCQRQYGPGPQCGGYGATPGGAISGRSRTRRGP